MLKVLVAAIGLSHIVLYSTVPQWWFGTALLMAMAFLLARWRAKRLLKVLFLYCFVFSAAATLGARTMQGVMSDVLPHAMDKQRVEVQLLITRIGTKSQRHQQFDAVIVSAPKGLGEHTLAGKKVRLSWYAKPSRPIPVLEIGQLWQAQVTLRRPRGLTNPGGFDYAVWLLAQGYSATGYLSAGDKTHLLALQPASGLERLRRHLSLQLSRLGHDNPSTHGSRFFKALIIGARDELNIDDWQVLQATGTVHLMAISGLHVGLVAAIGFWLGLGFHRLLLMSIRRYCYGLIGLWGYRLLPVIMAVSFAAGYALLAGFAVPTRRALVAVVLVNMAWSMGVRFAPSHLLALALLLVALSEPFAWLQAGFWLSFAAVALLLLKFNGSLYCQSMTHAGLSPRRQWCARGLQRLQFGVAMQWLLSLAMCLPLWVLGFPASGLSPLANMVAVPLVAMVFVPGLLLWVLLSFTPLGAPFLKVLSLTFDGLWWGLVQLAHSPAGLVWPSFTVEGVGAAVALVLLAIAGSLMLLPRTMALPLAGLSVLVVLALGGQHKGRHFDVTVLDVGQGLAVVTQVPDAPGLVFDTGAAFGERFNAGAHIVAPYLRRKGLSDVAIMVSHGDADHKGGLVPLLKQFSPSDVWSGERFTGLPEAAKPCHAGQQWHWGGARFKVLWPRADEANVVPVTAIDKRVSGNNLSCVLLVEYAGVVFLLPGDIDKTVEQWLVAQAVLPEVDVLIAPHHGSKTSSSETFLHAINPAHIVVSAGFKSRYGHPHASVLKRYKVVGAQIWNTAVHGAVNFTVSSDGDLRVYAERLENPKIWH